MTETRELELLEFIHKNTSFTHGGNGEFIIDDVNAFVKAMEEFFAPKQDNGGSKEIHNEG